MEVLRDDVPAFKFIGERCGMCRRLTLLRSKNAVALLRHLLSHYRETWKSASDMNLDTPSRTEDHVPKLDKIIGFLPTTNANRARDFYEGKLGLQFVSDDPYALVMRAGSSMIRIAKVQTLQPAPYTVLGWEVLDIAKVVAELKGKGVASEKYPFIQDQELGIWISPDGSKVAWFKDPDGNVLSVSQFP